MPTEIHYDKENPEAYLGAAIVAYTGALELAMNELAEVQGTDNLQWFDDLHAAIISAAKGTTTEEISIEVDAGAVGFGLQVLEADLKGIRRRLIEK